MGLAARWADSRLGRWAGRPASTPSPFVRQYRANVEALAEPHAALLGAVGARLRDDATGELASELRALLGRRARG